MAAAEKRSLFEFTDYKPYIRQWIFLRPSGGRGEKSRIAERARCQLAYVSQVLNGSAHFSVEQAEALNPLFEHTEEEADFFLLLVQRARAGTPSLKKYIDRKIQKVLEARLLLKNRLTHQKALSREDQATYYSSWSYAAVHLALLVPELRTPQALARYFGIEAAKVIEILEFLCSVGLAQKGQGQFEPGEKRIHLENDSPMISKHHTNWRIQAIRSFERTTPGELHYSSIVGISHADVPRAREILVQAIEQVRAIVRESKDEAVYCYALDLFGLGS